MIRDDLDGLDRIGHDVCIIGSGPVGITLALELSRQGRSVLMLESGGLKPRPETVELSAADIVEAARHDDMRIAVARRLGGTSNLWAGRCQPFDAIDFESRAMVGDAHWPISRETLDPYYARACVHAHCGAAVFREPIAGVSVTDDTFDFTRTERFSNRPKFQIAHAGALASNPRIDIRLNTPVVDALFGEEGRIGALVVCRPDGGRHEIPVATVVLAAGGLESTRLLLALQRGQPARFGGEGGPLGRTYMGHLIGEVADITFATDAIDRAYDFHVDGYGSYVRRRLVPSDALQRRDELPNVSFWPVVPPSSDPRHGSGILSLVLLALSVGPLGRLVVAEAIRKRHVPDRFERWPHVLNVLRGMPAAMAYLPSFFYRRHVAAMRLPGFFIRNRSRTYGLSYHGEHLPDPESRVVLSDAVDRFGLPRLSIDLRFDARNAEGLLRAHDRLGAWLERTGLGRMAYRQPREATAEAILAQAAHGTHQIGTMRMGRDRKTAIVDRDLRSFDCANLHVVGAGVLPTEGQANPTLTALALAVRLADHLAAGRARPLS